MAPPGAGEMDPDDVEEIRRYSPSGTSKTLRACLRCRQVMNKDQFIELGCPNCRDTLAMQGNEGRVLACTTSNFQGFISLIRPGAFASRFIGLEHRRPGCYALTVKGVIPDHILHESDAESDLGASRRRGRSEAPASRTGSGGGAGRKEDSSGEEEALTQPVVKAPQGDAMPEEAPTAEVPTAEVPTEDVPTEDVPVPPSPPSPPVHSNTPPTLLQNITPPTVGVVTPPTAGIVSPSVADLGQATPLGGGITPEVSPGGSTPRPMPGGSTPKRRRLDVQAGEQELILEPEADAEFGGP